MISAASFCPVPKDVPGSVEADFRMDLEWVSYNVRNAATSLHGLATQQMSRLWHCWPVRPCGASAEGCTVSGDGETVLAIIASSIL